MRRKNGKRKTGFRLLLVVVLVMCGVLTYSTGKAKAEERTKIQKKAEMEQEFASEEERQNELEEEAAYRQTKSYLERIAREKLGMVKSDEIILRENDAE